MKNLILITTFYFLFSVISQAAITWSGDYTGTPDEVDIRAAVMIIDLENERRAALETPLPALPKANNSQIAASAKIAVNYQMSQWWASYQKQASVKELETGDLKARWAKADDATRAQILALLPVVEK